MEQVPEQKKTNVILQYGGLSALVYLLVFVVLYLLGADSFLSIGGYSSALVPIVFAVVGCIVFKKENGGFLEFREALKISFAILVITSLASTIFSYILFNFIDPAFGESMTQVALEQQQRMLEKFGAPQEAIDKAVKDTLSRNLYSLPNLFQTFMFYCIAQFIFALIIAAIVKKKRPEFA